MASSSREEEAAPQASSELAFTYVDDSQFNYGRVDPGRDENILLVDGLKVVESVKRDCPWNDSKDETRPNVLPANMSGKDHLTVLPSELIDRILTFLDPADLTVLFRTSRILSSHAKEDILWQRCIQENIPGVTLASPTPCVTYRELYSAHDPYWFLPQYKIWFCDYFFTGKIMIARYDPRRGCIEGYRLVAERSPVTFDTWEADEEVVIHSFEPKTRLHKDQPIVHFDPTKFPLCSVKGTQRLRAEIPMVNATRNANGVFSNFFLTRPVEERPGMALWPPPTIPARHRVRNVSQEGFVGDGHKPQNRAEISHQAFRLRHWMQMTGQNHAPGVHLGEEVYTYATLDPKLYTPTEEKPWRGIWVGDYSGHGCEFLLMNQPDNEEPFDESSVIQKEDETLVEFEARKKDERIYRGRIEAIKLTGDPHVPRGEYTFIADDISQAGYIRTADEARFHGARIVKSRGHIAATMFRNDKYIESQLIMVSNNRLAQYWVGFGHISFYERVDIERFLNPEDDPIMEVPTTMGEN